MTKEGGGGQKPFPHYELLIYQYFDFKLAKLAFLANVDVSTPAAFSKSDFVA